MGRLVLVCSTGALAAALLPLAAHGLRASDGEWAGLCVLAAASTAAAGARAHDGRRRGAAAVFLVTAALLLPPGLAPLAALGRVLGSLAPRTRRLVVLQETFAAALATLAASSIAHGASDRQGPASSALALAAAAAFVGVAGSLEAAYGLADRRRTRRRAPWRRLGADALPALLGVGLAVFWRSDPWLAPLAMLPLVLAHRSQRLRAAERQAATDAKTGLLNMHAFGAALEAALARARVERQPLSLVVADLDLLREINNEHGHLVGDAVIRGIADVLRQELRRGDLAARFGGEEFVIALPGTRPDRAIRIAERIRETVGARVFIGGPSGATTRATISAGVAAYPRDAGGASALVHAADLAVIEAKARGRNRTVDAAALRASSRRPLAAALEPARRRAS